MRVGSEPNHQSHDVQTAPQGGHLYGGVAILVEKVDVYLVVVTTEEILQFTVITIPQSLIES